MPQDDASHEDTGARSAEAGSADSQDGTAAPEPEPGAGPLAWFDRWMASHPWHPRIVPFFVYGVFLAFIPPLAERWPVIYAPLYVLQCSLTLALLWRYRRLTPELNWRFHWLGAVVGVAVFVAWVALGWWMAGEFGERWAALLQGELLGRINYEQLGIEPPGMATTEEHFLERLLTALPALAWTALVLRLLGMSIVVPMFEELFIRSLLLRSFHSFRRTAIGVIQIAQDMPLIGDMVMGTKLGERADRHPPIFGREFHANPLGSISVFGIAASTLIFTSYHAPRDYLGCIVCGIAYCLLVAATNPRRSMQNPEPRNYGLGPVIWAHAITNALIWVYTIASDDWQFL